MACETYLKIAEKCKKKFVQQQRESGAAGAVIFIQELLAEIEKHTHELQPHQQAMFYQAVGHMISAEQDPALRDQVREHSSAVERCGPTLPYPLPYYGPLIRGAVGPVHQRAL